jgi:tyrosyl-tRNA synthetase
MDFIEELRWRGMLHDVTPGAEEFLKNNIVTGYIGFDPTAPSLTIGNYVQIMLLNIFQKCGHKPIVLMGGATGRIGDPSGKDKERELKSEDELDNNLKFQVEQVKKLLNFEGNNPAMIVNNFDFYKNMNILTFLRDVGKTLTVNYMMSKDSVKNRLETGLSFTEFSYQLLQAYDYLCLYNEQNCNLQMGGSDQWGNITSGTEFIRRHVENGKAYAVTTPLLTKSDGKKFGKSEKGNIWLDPSKTSPYAFYQFWIKDILDDDVEKMIKYFTFKSHEEVNADLAAHSDNPKHLIKLLAEELTERIHGKDSLEKVQQVSELLFGKSFNSKESLLSLDVSQFNTIGAEIPSKKLDLKSDFSINIIDLLTEHTGLCPSKGEARKAIQSNAISINKIKVDSIEMNITSADLLHDKFILLENGKKNKFLLSI